MPIGYEYEPATQLIHFNLVATVFFGDQPLQFSFADKRNCMLTALFREFRAPVVRNMGVALVEVEAIRGSALDGRTAS